MVVRKAKMTKEEFINYYTRNGNLQGCKTKDGYSVPGRTPRIALPCNCDYASCMGWVMIPDKSERIKDHLKKQALRQSRMKGFKCHS